MKWLLLFCCTAICYTSVTAQQQVKAGFYTVPDSVKATGFITDIIFINKKDPKRMSADIGINNTFYAGLYKNKNKKNITWDYRERRQLKEMMQLVPYQWNYNTQYKLLLQIASDSAKNNSIWSAYIYLPNENKWKLVHVQTVAAANFIHSFFAASYQHKKYAVQFSNRWLQRSNNTWKALDSQITKPPVLRPMSNIDSVAQQQSEENELRDKLPKDSVVYKEGIFYQLLKEGTGRLVSVSDTVVVYYKGWLFSNGNVFDETKEKPAAFPLSRLIKGWQVGVPECRVGGKIRLFLPSGSAYGIRTFSTNIPPNSTLVFDVEVLEVKEKL
jgi:FKBP-type peptidyl-prolyl cis-trans isomerase FkpA